MRAFTGLLCLAVLTLPVLIPPAPTLAADAAGVAGEPDDGLVLGWYVSGMGGMINREWAFGADAFLDLSVKGFRMTVGAPLRFHAHGFRMQYWDEVADFGRLVREVSYTRPKDRLSIAIAPVSGFGLGVGNLVSRFNSTVDADHWRTGFTGSWDSAYGGVAMFMDSVLAPEVAGGRIYVRPFQAIHPGGFVGRMEIGGTLVADFKAPARYRRVGRKIALGNADLPLVERRHVMGAGLDVRWPVYQSDSAEVVPYFAMSMVGSGSGLHTGLALDIRAIKAVRFGLAAEWRYLGPGYVAPYFDSLYMVDRWDFSSSDPYNAKTKARMLDDVLDTRMGAMAAVFVKAKDLLMAWVRLDWDAKGEYSQLGIGADINVLDLVGIRLNLAQRGFTSFKGLFHPNRLVFAGAVDVNVLKNVSIFGVYSRDVSIRTAGTDLGLYRPTDGFQIGVRVGFQYQKDAGKSGNKN
ncbi:MAG: hypothetical protein GXP54_02150 [Deltaproteobacteria bacterium]|nr:hypothetical protein [Deltaproteobacteria bacterium]